MRGTLSQNREDHTMEPATEPSTWVKRRQQVEHFFAYDLWRPLPPLTTPKGIGYRLLRFGHIVVRGFREDGIRLHAASLTYYTLIALIPLLAVSLAMLKGLGYDKQLEQFLVDYFAAYPDELRNFIDEIMTALKAADFASIGAVGVVMLFIAVIGVLNRIEDTFNHIWSIERSRSWLRNATNYTAIMVIVPLALVVAISLVARLQLGDEETTRRLSSLVPFVVTWLAFSFLYQAMPNTNVKFIAALAGGFWAALLWWLWLRFYITFQPAVNRYNVIYGTLAVFPIFLIWLFVNWSIILLGAKLTFAVQNSKSYRPDHYTRGAGPLVRLQLALSILHACTKAANQEGPAFTRTGFEQQTRTPRPLLERVLTTLTQAGYLAETDEEEPRLLLTTTPDRIPLTNVLMDILKEGETAESLGLADMDPEVKAQLDSYINLWKDKHITLAGSR